MVYAAFNVAFTVWMLQSYFATIPRELEEAAWLEGRRAAGASRPCSCRRRCRRIAVAGIFCFVNAWNEFVIALTMLRQQDSYTLPIQVFSLVAGRYTVEWHHVMAATLRRRCRWRSSSPGSSATSCGAWGWAQSNKGT